MTRRCTKDVTQDVLIMIGSFVLHFVSLGILKSFGIIYTELVVYFEAPKSDTSWIASIGFGLFLSFGVLKRFGIIYTELVEYFEAPKSDTSWIASIGNGLFLSFGPVSGIIEEKYGCRMTGLLGSLFIGVGLLSSAFVRDMYLLYVTYGVITGIGFSLSFVAANVKVNVHFKKRRALAVGISSAGGGVGNLVLPLLCTYLIEKYGWQGTFLILSGVGLQGVYCSLLLGDPHSSKRISAEGLEKAPPKTTNIGLQERTQKPHSKSEDTILQKTKKILSSRKFILFKLSSICVSIAYFVPYLMIPDMARERGTSKENVALMVTISGFSSLASRIVFGYVSDLAWWNRVIANGFALIILGAGTGITHLFTEDYLFFLYTALLGIVTGLFGLYQSVVLVDLVGKDYYALAFGYLTFLEGVALLIGPPLAGLFYDLTGDYQLTFIVCGILFCIGGILSLLIRFGSGNDGTYSLKTTQCLEPTQKNNGLYLKAN